MSWGGLINNMSSKFVNYDSSGWSGGLTNRVIPNHGLPEPSNNIAGANSYIKGCTGGGGGGRRRMRRRRTVKRRQNTKRRGRKRRNGIKSKE